MQEIITSPTNEEEQYRQYKRMRRLEEARASVSKIECDCLSLFMNRATLKQACHTANELRLGAVVTFPSLVKQCVSYLGNDPKVSLIASVSHPDGGETTSVKAAAVKRAVKDGVDEVEVAAPITYIRDGNWAYFKKECKKLKKAAKVRALRIVLDCNVLGEKDALKAAIVAADAGVNCIRLNGAGGEFVTKVKTALKGKCLIKCDGATTPAAFANFCVLGADTVSCVSACELASFLLNEAETV